MQYQDRDMNFLNANPTAVNVANRDREYVCVGTVAAEAAAANEGDTVSLGGIWD
jgi:hypothetical protein